MSIHLTKAAGFILTLLCLTVAAPLLNAQIANAIRAHIGHSFIVGNTTYPAGEYTFRMLPGSDISIMTVTNENDKTSGEFAVRESVDGHRPNHSELVFKKYGDDEFPTKVYEGGSKTGVAVTETSRQEARLMKQGHQAEEHTEEQR